MKAEAKWKTFLKITSGGANKFFFFFLVFIAIRQKPPAQMNVKYVLFKHYLSFFFHFK